MSHWKAFWKGWLIALASLPLAAGWAAIGLHTPPLHAVRLAFQLLGAMLAFHFLLRVTNAVRRAPEPT